MPEPPRRWIRGIKNKLTKEKRAAFKVQVVKKKKRTDGTTSVSGTHIADMLSIADSVSTLHSDGYTS